MLALENNRAIFLTSTYSMSPKSSGRALLNGFVVTGQHQNRHAEAADQKAVQTILPNRQTVYPHILKGGNPGVAEDAVRRPGFGVIANKQRPIKAGVKALELA